VKRHSLLVLQLLSFTLMGGVGTFVNYINLYLEQELGLTGSEIGLVTMISMGLVIFINPILGYIGDRTGKHILMLKCAFFLSTLFVFLYSQASTFLVVLVVAILFEISRACIGPFFDLITTDYCAKTNYEFGKVRVFASIGFMFTVMSVGFLIAGVNLPWFNGTTIGFEGFLDLRTAVFGAIMVLLGLSFILMFFVPRPEVVKVKGEEKEKFNRADIMDLLTNKRYQFILVFIVLSLVAFESAKAFVGNHLVVGLGSAESIVSVLTFVMVFPEFILLPLGARIIRKFGFKKWYIFTMITLLVRIITYAFTTNVIIFIMISAVHGFGVVTHVAGNITFIRKVVKPKVLGLSFSIMVSILAFSRAIMSFVYGFLYERYDGFIVFRVATVVIFLGLLWVLKSKSLSEIERSDI